jgi:hypothetical protein
MRTETTAGSEACAWGSTFLYAVVSGSKFRPQTWQAGPIDLTLRLDGNGIVTVSGRVTNTICQTLNLHFAGTEESLTGQIAAWNDGASAAISAFPE